jgi:hypothetical protein
MIQAADVGKPDLTIFSLIPSDNETQVLVSSAKRGNKLRLLQTFPSSNSAI